MEFLSQKKQFTPPDNLETKFPVEEVKRFIADCLVVSGASRSNAEIHAEVVVAADTRGHFSHGLQRLDLYVAELQNKSTDGRAVPKIVREFASGALVDGNNGLGTVVGDFCMDLAIKKAKTTGIACVCCKGSNHFGIAGWYGLKASKQGLIGMSFTNAFPGVLANRAKEAAVGTNPICFVAPGKKEDDCFALDMATSVVSSGKVEVAALKKESIPHGWLVDENGKVTSDPSWIKDGLLLPLGGLEELSGYKGYGLGMMVEVLCGIMTGGDYGSNIRDWKTFDRPGNLSQCFIAINPTLFAPGFEDRMSDFNKMCRDMEPADPKKPVLVAGDPERNHIRMVEAEGGITYHPNQAKESWQTAKYLNVAPMKPVEQRTPL